MSCCWAGYLLLLPLAHLHLPLDFEIDRHHDARALTGVEIGDSSRRGHCEMGPRRSCFRELFRFDRKIRTRFTSHFLRRNHLQRTRRR